MDKTAIKHAWEELHQAQKALGALERSQNFAQTERAWIDFLTAAGRIFSKLETGAKTDGRSSAWFGRVKHERKKDPLLRYVHHARNTAEHGITEITQRVNGGLAIGGDVLVEHFSWNADGVRGKIHAINPERPMSVVVLGPHVQLVPVFDDRFKDTCDVPREHLDKPLDSASPFAIASLALQYLERLIRDGSKLTK